MGMLRIMSRRGDDRVTWDSTRTSVVGSVVDDEADAAVREAQRIFQEQRARGATAFLVQKGQAPVRIDTFDPTAEQIVMVPRTVGG